MIAHRNELTPHETQAIVDRVARGFDGEPLPIEAHLQVVLLTDAYDGDDLDEADKIISDGLARLVELVRSEVPF